MTSTDTRRTDAVRGEHGTHGRFPDAHRGAARTGVGRLHRGRPDHEQLALEQHGTIVTDDLPPVASWNLTASLSPRTVDGWQAETPGAPSNRRQIRSRQNRRPMNSHRERGEHATKRWTSPSRRRAACTRFIPSPGISTMSMSPLRRVHVSTGGGANPKGAVNICVASISKLKQGTFPDQTDGSLSRNRISSLNRYCRLSAGG